MPMFTHLLVRISKFRWVVARLGFSHYNNEYEAITIPLPECLAREVYYWIENPRGLPEELKQWLL